MKRLSRAVSALCVGADGHAGYGRDVADLDGPMEYDELRESHGSGALLGKWDTTAAICQFT